MDKDKNTDFINWYDLWMKQSKYFYESADKHLKDMFAKGALGNPEDHLKQVNEWLETLKKQWQFANLSEEQKAFANYWQTMSKMCSDGADLMMQQWIKRFQDKDPIKNTHELYELWLSCCHEVYQKSLQTKSYQDTYGEFMNTAMKFWKSYTPNK